MMVNNMTNEDYNRLKQKYNGLIEKRETLTQLKQNLEKLEENKAKLELDLNVHVAVDASINSVAGNKLAKPYK